MRPAEFMRRAGQHEHHRLDQNDDAQRIFQNAQPEIQFDKDRFHKLASLGDTVEFSPERSRFSGGAKDSPA
jgi:hypothetical protein